MNSFQSQVIEKSFDKPVVVDFWAPWCGPCRVLGPVIEKLAEEQSEKWDLVKVNTEEEQELALQYKIRSIPNVKMFYKGEAVAEFSGALPKSAIEKWLAEHLPDDRHDAFSQLKETMEHSPSKEQLEKLKAFVRENPDFEEAGVTLAKLEVFNNPEQSAGWVANIRMGDPLYDQAQDVQTIARFLQTESFDASPAGEALSKARLQLQEKAFQPAVESVIEAVTNDKSYRNDLPRKLAISIFRLLGNQHPVTKNFRWKFDMALY